MRLHLKILCLVNILIVLVLVYQSFYLILLLHDRPMTTDGISRAELANGTFAQEEAVIPKIIHQIYIGEAPSIWQEAQESIKQLHPDFKYMFWNDEMGEEFISTNYGWFLKTYQKYKYPVMKADALRYFILHHHGGVYMDMDNGLNERMDPLLKFPAWLRKTHPTGISNDLMGAVPRHPYFEKVIHSLQQYKRDWIVPYITVMYSTGPLFASVIFQRYLRTVESHDSDGKVRVLMSRNDTKTVAKYKLASEIFFTMNGSSWHNKDASSILFMQRHWIFFIVFFTILGFSLFFLALCIELKLIQMVMLLISAVCKRLHFNSTCKTSRYDGHRKLWNSA